jgi:DNA uptake protein ComE-like DNA-binding protein
LEAPVSRSDRILVATAGGAVILAVAAAVVLLAPPAGDAASVDDGSALLLGTPTPPGSVPPFSASATGTILVDVEGAVTQPGIRELPAGSRVADAIAAAGGYASDVDPEAASASINLAQPLTDAQQVHVPRLGDAEVAAPAGSQPPADVGGASAGGLVDLNTATPEELEALPGIGPVTVQKIAAARQERPFSSLEDALQRGVINRGQLDDIEGVATAG